MYIKSVIIDGFKSYGKRTEIHGFDPEFTAITGLNGTGKSNILDAICFVLGITNLGQVRATSLQDLIFKCGQAGVTKATVTLVFDNTDPTQCPFGYEKCREISVTRQIVMGGKNKYMINGKNVLNKKVHDLFCSIQLNVNNPSFLIMQGRITKVLNMKPHEILSMIEEAAGTSLYESKKEASCKLIEKKDAKVRETNTLLKEEVEPKLDKLRKDRALYTEFTKISRDIEYLTRIHISYKYLKQKESLQTTEENVKELTTNVENSKQTIKQNEMQIIQIDKNCENIQIKIDSQNDGEMHKLEEELSSKQKLDAANLGKRKALKEQIDQDNRKINALKKSIKDDENTLKIKQNQMEKFENCFKELKEMAENDLKFYTESQKKFEAISQGLSADDDGGAATLQDQLMTAKTQIIESQTTIKKSEMELEHTKNVLKQKQGETQANDSIYLKDKNLHDKLGEEIKRIKIEMSKTNYEDGYLEKLEMRHMQLTQDIRDLQIELDRKGSYRYELKYNDPEPNFDRNKVHGMVGKLFRIKNENDCLALMMCASGNLYSYVTDDDITSKKILQKGQLQKRVTIIPINKITSSPIHANVIRFAQNLVGEENVCSALSLIEYDNHFDPVMKYVFGHTLICRDINIAKQVTYHKNIMCRSVTLEGDVLDPQGTLSGGARPKGANVLKELSEIMNIEEKIRIINQELYEIDQKIECSRQFAKSYNTLKEKLELRQHELSACAERLSKTAFQQNQQEIQDLKQKIESLQVDLVNAKKMHANSTKKVKDIEMKLSDAKGYRERELKLAQDTMTKAKKKYEESENNWKRREQEYETLKLEIEEIEKGIESTKQQLNEMNATVEKLNADMKGFEDKSKDAKQELDELKQKIKEKKDQIMLQSKELKKNYQLKEKLNKQIDDLNLDIKKKEIEIAKINASNKNNFDHLKQLEDKYPWIKEDYEFFGTKNTRYDYSKEDPIAAGAKVIKLTEQKEKIERNINMAAMMLLNREEEQYKETMRRKKIVEEDKEKIKNIICKMDEKKKEKIDTAWKSVDKNFSSIFSTLLPGAQAKLKAIYQNNKLHGLEIMVGFNGVWKESLGELSGGQRSLVALSLVLAMLKFSPAPLYILDEVDAALDMSHTQNIGSMLKMHFTNSQFIIVSLKDGMFNNANVLYRTKFEEGVSAVTRTVNTNRKN